MERAYVLTRSLHTSAVPLLLAALIGLAGLTSGCGDRSSSSSADNSAYGRYGSDPSVDLKRRDVLPPEEPAALDTVLSTFELADGFQIELFAAEPLVTDPVAMTVDAAGRMYVVELHGYPDDESGSSTIKRLTDTDGDGRPDESTVFAEGLRMPKGVMPWKEGLLVTDAPEVLYLEDTDGDGRADAKRTMLTGFDKSNPQLGVNTPIYGLDNWIYMAHMSGSDSVRFTERPGRTYDASGRNVRLRPGDKKLEALAARSQYGHTFDAWGRHLLNTNSNHIYQEALAARYLKRNPDLLVSSTTEVISDHGASAKMYPITPDSKNRLGKAGGITSASGLVSYQGGLFPAPYRHVTFIGAPIYNAVHVDKLSEGGGTLVARRMQEKKEFLASTDRWFRPVSAYVGPGGALYVIDYSRRVLEQPKFLTEEVLNSADIYAGADRGRIYRIVPAGAEAASWLGSLALGEASIRTLVQALERENLWWRRTAQRLLVDRQDQAATGPLAQLAENSALPEARLHALWTLEGLGALKPELIRKALQDESAGVRENALRLAERHLEESPELAEALVAMGAEPKASVRYQLLLALGYVDTKPARALRQKLLFENIESKWMQLATLSAFDAQPLALYDQAVAKLSREETEGRQAYFQRLGALIGASKEEDHIRQVLRRSAEASAPGSDWWRAASLMGLAEGMEQQNVAMAAVAQERDMLLDRFFEVASAPMRSAYLRMLSVVRLPEGPSRKAALKEAANVATDRQAEPERRADAVRLLGMSDPGSHAQVLEQLIDPQEPTPVQQAAVQALGRAKGKGEQIGTLLLSRWGDMTPAVRREAAEVMLDDQARLFMLFDAIEAGTVSPTAIPRHRDEDLVEHENDKIRQRANEVLRRESGKRQEIIAEYQAALNMRGNAERGRQAFQRACSRCHPASGEGTPFGPDIAELENRPPSWFLRAILAPNRVVAEGYDLWTVKRENGETVSGIISSETPTSITVRGAGGQEVRIPREGIQSMTEAGVSAMPEGLENQISKQEMADLIEYLMSVQTVN